MVGEVLFNQKSPRKKNDLMVMFSGVYKVKRTDFLKPPFFCVLFAEQNE